MEIKKIQPIEYNPSKPADTEFSNNAGCIWDAANGESVEIPPESPTPPKIPPIILTIIPRLFNGFINKTSPQDIDEDKSKAVLKKTAIPEDDANTTPAVGNQNIVAAAPANLNENIKAKPQVFVTDEGGDTPPANTTVVPNDELTTQKIEEPEKSSSTNQTGVVSENKEVAAAKPEATAVKYHDATINSYREGGDNQGFCEDWIEEDAYGSKTYSEWLENNGYTYNKELAEKIHSESKKNAFNRSYYHNCGASLRKSLEKAANFASLECYKYPRHSAYMYGRILANNKHFKELPHNIVESMDLTKLPRGCVIVYDANYKDSKKDNHTNGHVGVTTGYNEKTGEPSREYGGYITRSPDHTITIYDKKQATHIRVFIPIVIETEETDEITDMQKP